MMHPQKINRKILGFLLSGAVRLINAQSREKHGGFTVFFSALTCFR